MQQLNEKLAIHGGTPVRKTMLPYSHQWIDEDDIAAVVEVLRSDWLTTGPKVEEFERAFADFVGAKEAVAVSSGTAALHAAMDALGIGPGDEVIVPAMTFAATAKGSTLFNCFGIGREVLDFVVDRSMYRQGCYLPGVHRSIYPPAKLLEAMLDYVLLLTWKFADEILKQQMEHRHRGGQFIVPVP